MKMKPLLTLILTLPLFSGCTMARIYSTSGNDVSMTDMTKSGGESFKIDHRMLFDYTGAVDVQELLRDRFGSGHKFENLSVKIKQEPADILINIVTIGIAQAKTFEIAGDKIK